MHLSLLGISHDTARLDVRELLAFAPEELVQALRHASGNIEGVSEIVIVSTCNRTELIVAGNSQSQDLRDWLGAYR